MVNGQLFDIVLLQALDLKIATQLAVQQVSIVMGHRNSRQIDKFTGCRKAT